MMIEFEDRDEEGRRLLLDYLARQRPAPCSACSGAGCEQCSYTGLAEHMPRRPEPSKPGCLWRLLGRLYVAWLRWRYGRRD